MYKRFDSKKQTIYKTCIQVVFLKMLYVDVISTN